MNTHLVRVNEKIEKIASLYHLNIEEIIKMNKHIQDWDHLIPGTKIRLPEISEMVQIELDNTEPFIEEYYPKIDVDTIKDNVQEKEIIVENSVDTKKEETEEKKPTINHSTKPQHSYLYPPYYPGGYYNPYYPYNYYRKSNRKRKSK